MSNNVRWERIVGKKTLEDGGYIGDLLELVRKHIEDARDKGQLTDEDVGQIYASMIPNIIADGIKFEQEDVIRELQIEAAQKDIELRLKQIDGVEIENQQKEKAVELAKKKIEDADLTMKIKEHKDIRDTMIHEETLTSMALQHEKQELDIKNLKSLIKARDEQVIDNRYIKTLEKIGAMLGATMNGGLKPHPSMMETFFTYAAKLNGIRTINKGNIDASGHDTNDTALQLADNRGVKYPYGGSQIADPSQRNDFTAHYWVIASGNTDSDGNLKTVTIKGKYTDTDGNTKYVSIADTFDKGDLVMQGGTPEEPALIKVSNTVKEQSLE